MLALPFILAQSVPLPPRPHLSATRVETPPVMDGKLDEPAWQKAPSTSSFTQRFPDDGKPPSGRTTVRVLYDHENLYVGVDCEQPNIPVVARLGRRDHDSETDSVTVSFDSERSGSRGVRFNVNAAGVLFDELLFNDTDKDPDWDDVWDARTDVRKDGWSAEIVIPLRSLRFSSQQEQSWGFQVARWIEGVGELSNWAYTPRAYAGQVSRFGSLDHLVDLEPSASSIELRPFVVGKVQRLDPSTAETARGTKLGWSAGGEIEWHPTQQLTVETTINPDFAQVEADTEVLNLTKFETYYREKREFFLEDLDDWKTPFQLFYSRRVGRVPANPKLRTGEELVNVPVASTVYAALKVTGKLADGWHIGTVQAATAANTVSAVTTDGKKVPRLVDPLSLFNVLRLKHDVTSSTTIGMMATAVSHAESESSYPLYPTTLLSSPNIVCPSGATVRYGARCFNDAYVGALDFQWNSPSSEYGATAQVASSVLHDGPSRSVLDGTKIRPGDVGTGGQFSLSKEGGDYITGKISGEYETPKFTYDDLGFMERANRIGAQAEADWKTHTSVWETKALFAHAQASGANNTHGLSLERLAFVFAGALLKNDWMGYAGAAYRARRYDDFEVGNGVALERAAFWDGFAHLQSPAKKPIAFTLDSQWAKMDDANWANITGKFTFHFIPSLDVEVSPQGTLNRGEVRSIGQFTPTGEPIFGRQAAPSFSTTLRAAYMFTPRLSIEAYSQLFLASIHYTNFSYAEVSGPHPVVHLGDLKYEPLLLQANPDSLLSALNINVVFRWEYRPSSVLYLVYQRAQIPNVPLLPGDVPAMGLGSIGNRAAATDSLVLKVSYWWG